MPKFEGLNIKFNDYALSILKAKGWDVDNMDWDLMPLTKQAEFFRDLADMYDNY